MEIMHYIIEIVGGYGVYQNLTLDKVYITRQEAESAVKKSKMQLECIHNIKKRLNINVDSKFFVMIIGLLMHCVDNYESYESACIFTQDFIIENFDKFGTGFDYYKKMKADFAKYVGYYPKFSLYEYNTLINDNELYISI
jgi:hypothetical protein